MSSDLNLPGLHLSRREVFRRVGMGMAGVALTDLLARTQGSQLLDGQALGNSATPLNDNAPLAARSAPLPAKAKRVIHVFLNGGPSHVDLFDPKPLLKKYEGKTLPITFATERKTGNAMPSKYKFNRHGNSGIELSELLPNIGSMADDLCVIRSMQADNPTHETSLLLMNCGEGRLIRPSFGSWMTYGLGTENQNLPAFIAMCPGGYPIQETQNWQSGFLPGIFQGTYIDTANTDIEKLVENVRNKVSSRSMQRTKLDLVQRLNQQHLNSRHGDAQLESRVHAFELAYRMQDEVAEAFDTTLEPQHIREMYGTDTQGRQMLTARRLVERGVRFVQVWTGGGQPWDMHDNLNAAMENLVPPTDRAVGSLLKDLKQRGMLDDTLVIIGGEFGRTPAVELPSTVNAGMINGRDHNHYGFTTILAGGGSRGGYVHGATDEFGFKSVEKVVHVHDLHATLLKLLGFDHEKFTYRSAGRDFRLTDVHGHVVNDLIA